MLHRGISRISDRRKNDGRCPLFSFHFKQAIDMKKIAKQVVGIDIAQNELVVSIGRMFDDFELEIYAGKSFANGRKGFDMLMRWVLKHTVEDVAVRYVMEATGVYHEQVAYFLNEQGPAISIVMPNKISNYMRTLDVKTVTDRTMADAITRFGLERRLDNWTPPSETYRKMKQLTRERDQLVDERTMLKNQLHAEQAGAYPSKGTISRLKARIAFINRQEAAIKKDIQSLIRMDEEIEKNVSLLSSIPGVGWLTSAIVLAETNGFELIRNRRQLTSYAGFDVKEKQSGTSVKKKPKISKKGNRHLRKAMHLPSLSAIKHNERYKAIYASLVSKHGIKMKAAVAVQRKLLELCYTLYKTQQPYDRKYLTQQETQQLHVTETE
jgi:transposase